MSSWSSFARARDSVAVQSEIERRERQRREAPELSKYADDPIGYARDVHNVWLWGKQAAVAESLTKPPYRVLVQSANSIGKTLVAAVLARWFHDCFDPGVCVVTGPRLEQLKDTTFKEIRRISVGHPGLYPKAPRLESSPNHYVNGTTASSGDAFQGIHCENIMLLFEECMGVDKIFWEAARGMKAGGSRKYWLAIHNPTNPSGHAHQEVQSGRWTVLKISAFEHPNIAAELTGNAAYIPDAVRLEQLLENMQDWGDSSNAWPSEAEREATDVDLYDPATYGVLGGDGASEIAPGIFIPIRDVIEGAARYFPGRFWRPGPVGESRILGRYPRESAYSIFAEAYFDAAGRLILTPKLRDLVTIGCDVARFGDDSTAIHVRRGGKSLLHETYNHRDTGHTAGRLKELCEQFAPTCATEPKRIPCNIDDNGVGGGVVDQAKGYNFIPVNAQCVAQVEDKYPNIHSEMLFGLAEKLAKGQISLRDLPSTVRDTLKNQSVGVTYSLDNDGRRKAEPSKKIKERLGHSPDDLIAFALAYYPAGSASLGGAVRVRDEEEAASSRLQQPPEDWNRSNDKRGNGGGGSFTPRGPSRPILGRR